MTRSRDVANIDTILTTKGDIYAASAAYTPARLGVGNNGETLVADSSATTGLRWQSNFAAGKNKVINGDFGIWQRGTSFTMTNGVQAYTADRFRGYFTHSSGTATISRQAFTAGTAPVAGYEGQFFLRATKPANNAYCIVNQPIEDVRTFAGQNVTLSFWAKVNSGTQACTAYVRQMFGTGGSSDVNYGPLNYTATTSWQRFSFTVTLTSIAGKTIGANNALIVDPIFNLDSNGYDIDLWGVQLEAGNTATAFQTATGTLAGELAACRRYLPAFEGFSGMTNQFMGYAYGTNTALYVLPFDVPARTAPTGITVTGSADVFALNAGTSVTPTFGNAGINSAQILASFTITAGQGSRLQLPSGTRILLTGCEL